MLNGRGSGIEWKNVDFPFKQPQFSRLILFCENFDHSNITCIVFSSIYVLYFFRPYTSVTSYNFLFLQNGTQKFDDYGELELINSLFVSHLSLHQRMYMPDLEMDPFWD